MNKFLVVFALFAILASTSSFKLRLKRQQPATIDAAVTDQAASAETTVETTNPSDETTTSSVDSVNTTPATEISPSSVVTQTPTAPVFVPPTTPTMTTSTRTPRDRIVDDAKEDPDDRDQ
jgi:hypothetical protein